MQNPPATVYRLNERFDLDNLYERLNGYSDSEYREEIDDNVITTIEQVERTERGLSFVVEFDYVHSLRQRDQDDPLHVKATRTADGRFCKNIASDGFILIGSDHDTAAKPVAKAITGDEEAFVRMKIAPTTITKIVSRDSQDARYQIWEDIDVFTNMASIQGRIEDSTYSQDFDEYGRAVWVMFDSNYLGETVGISKNGFVVYASDVDPADIEAYFFNVIKETIES